MEGGLFHRGGAGKQGTEGSKELSDVTFHYFRTLLLGHAYRNGLHLITAYSG
jgi:hypothetical protein